MTNIIGLSGFAQAGKDSVGAILCNDYGYERRAFADKLRTLAEMLNPRVQSGSYDPRCTVPLSQFLTLGWDAAKRSPGPRKLLQDLGVACREVLGEDVWVNALRLDMEPFKRYVITDVRFPNEAQMIRDLGGQVWRISRPNTHPSYGHVTDTALDGYEFDRYIDNSGTLQDLRAAVLNSGDVA